MNAITTIAETAEVDLPKYHEINSPAQQETDDATQTETNKPKQDQTYSGLNKKIIYGPYEIIKKNIIFNSKPLSLKCLGNSKFVGKAENSLELVLISEKISGMQNFFEFQYISGGLIAIISKLNNRYVCAENAGELPLAINRRMIYGTWEVFEIHDHQSDGSISLKSISNGKFISGLSDKLLANKQKVKSDWEKFKIVNFVNF